MGKDQWRAILDYTRPAAARFNNRQKPSNEDRIATPAIFTGHQPPITSPIPYGSIFAVNNAPPVDEFTSTRRNRARTPVTVRASPAVAVDVSIAKYSEATSADAPCSVKLTADGAVPKMVCHRTVCP
jgi:hypothetical protein